MAQCAFVKKPGAADVLPIRIYRKAVLPVLAAFLAAMAIVYFTLKPDRFSATGPLAVYIDEHLDPDDLASTGHELYTPLIAYYNASYPEAIRQFSAVDVLGKPFRDTLEFYLGAAYLNSGRPAEAVVHFDNLMSMDHSVYKTTGAELRAAALSLTERRTADRLHERIPFRRNWITRWLLVFATIFVLAGVFYRFRFEG